MEIKTIYFFCFFKFTDQHKLHSEHRRVVIPASSFSVQKVSGFKRKKSETIHKSRSQDFILIFHLISYNFVEIE